MEARNLVTEYTIGVLNSIITAHRRKDMLTCPEDCMCWEIEALVMKLESKGASDDTDTRD